MSKTKSVREKGNSSINVTSAGSRPQSKAKPQAEDKNSDIIEDMARSREKLENLVVGQDG